MFEWKKLRKVFDPTSIDECKWMNTHAQSPSAIVLNDRIRVFFCCRPKIEDRQCISRVTYVDFDKSNPSKLINIAKKPVLPLGNLGTFDEFGSYPVSCIQSKEKIICIYGGWTRCESVPCNVSLGLAISDNNGYSFDKIGEGPILSFSPNEPFIISSPRIRRYNGAWYLFYITGREWILDDKGKPEPVYKIRMAISEDLYHWKKLDRDIISDKIGKNEAQASPDVTFYNGYYHMFFSYRNGLDFRTDRNNTYRIGYAYSNDLQNWTRDDSQVGIDFSDSGWDSEMIAYPNVFELDNKLYMLYQGNEFGKYGFGLAILEN